MSGLEVGLRATITADVTDADTAQALGSGDVPVLGTPRLLALAEAACVAAVAPNLDLGQTTVGIAVSMEHTRASPVGAPIEVEAELTRIDGRKLWFNFIAYGQGEGDTTLTRGDDPPDPPAVVIGAGTVERMLVDTERFLARLQREG